MSRFFVGQRVRIVDCDDPSDLEAMRLVGCEAVVDSIDIVNEEGDPGNIGVTVGSIDSFCFWPWELEPILPSGHQPAELTVEELLPFLRKGVTA